MKFHLVFCWLLVPVSVITNRSLFQHYQKSIISAANWSHLTSVGPSCVRQSICNCQLWKQNFFTIIIFWRLTWTLLILSHRDSGGLRIAPATPQNNPSMTTWCSPTQYCLSSTQYCALYLISCRLSAIQSGSLQKSKEVELANIRIITIEVVVAHKSVIAVYGFVLAWSFRFAAMQIFVPESCSHTQTSWSDQPVKLRQVEEKLAPEHLPSQETWAASRRCEPWSFDVDIITIVVAHNIWHLMVNLCQLLTKWFSFPPFFTHFPLRSRAMAGTLTFNQQ